MVILTRHISSIVRSSKGIATATMKTNPTRRNDLEKTMVITRKGLVGSLDSLEVGGGRSRCTRMRMVRSTWRCATTEPGSWRAGTLPTRSSSRRQESVHEDENGEEYVEV